MKLLKAEMKRYSKRRRHFYCYMIKCENREAYILAANDYPLIDSIAWAVIKSEFVKK